MIILVFIFLVIAYFILVYIPSTLLYEYSERKRMKLYETVGIKKISARKEWKRRSSWPLAYSNVMVTDKDI
jgi:hypothetical protein